MSDAKGRTPFLESRSARGVAVLVFLGCVAVLGYLHRDDLFPESRARASAANDAFGRCIAPRREDIAELERQGIVEPAEAKLFRARAEALCRDLARKAEKGREAPGR